MDVIGKWKLVSLKGMDFATFEQVWRSNEELLAADDDDMYKMMADAMFEFKDGGILSVCSKVAVPEGTPESEIEAAIAAGEVIRADGALWTVRDLAWKEENGEILVDSGERGEVFGEAIDPWKKLEIAGNTLIISDQYQVVREGELPSEVKKTVKELKTASPETQAAAGIYKGLYTKFVGDGDDAKNTDEAFRLELAPDGTGMSFRDDLEIKVPDWSVEDGKVKLTEKFLGTIDYTGTLDGNRLSLFNGEPESPLTCQYVFEKE